MVKQYLFKLSGDGNEYKIKVTDILGKEYMIYKRDIVALDHQDNYYISKLYLEEIKHYAFKEGIEVKINKYVKVARIELIEIFPCLISRIIEKHYLFFKPTIKYTNELNLEEVK